MHRQPTAFLAISLLGASLLLINLQPTTAAAAPSIFDEFGPTPRTYGAGGHRLHPHSKGDHRHEKRPSGSEYDTSLLDFPELDYGKASAVHKAAAAAAAALGGHHQQSGGPPVYYAQQQHLSAYGPTPTPALLTAAGAEPYVAESTVHHRVNDYHQHPRYPTSPVTPHPYRAEGEAQIDVHSSPEGFSYQVVEERGHGSYSHVSQTRDFSKKVPSSYHRELPAPSYHQHLPIGADHHGHHQHGHHHHHSPHYDHEHLHHAGPAPKIHHHALSHPHGPPPDVLPLGPLLPSPSSYLDPLPSPSPSAVSYLADPYDHPPHPYLSGHHTSPIEDGAKPRTYAASSSHPKSAGSKGRHSKNYGQASHGVRSYVVS